MAKHGVTFHRPNENSEAYDYYHDYVTCMLQIQIISHYNEIFEVDVKFHFKF